MLGRVIGAVCDQLADSGRIEVAPRGGGLPSVGPGAEVHILVVSFRGGGHWKAILVESDRGQDAAGAPALPFW